MSLLLKLLDKYVCVNHEVKARRKDKRKKKNRAVKAVNTTLLLIVYNPRVDFTKVPVHARIRGNFHSSIYI